MSKAAMEIDFFPREKGSSSSSRARFQKIIERRSSFQGMQEAIQNAFKDSGIAREKIGRKFVENGGFLTYETVFLPNGEVIARENPFSLPSTPTENRSLVLPVSSKETPPGTPFAPLTIFYNGRVSVFEVPHDKAETIMKLAETRINSQATTNSLNSQLPLVPSSLSDNQNLLESLNGDLPIARKKSLHRFLEKRKERLTFVPPYARH